MKNIFLAFAISVTGFVMNRADAQLAGAGTTIQSAVTTGFNNTAGTNENGGALSVINARAMKDFQKTFHGIQNETWLKVADGGYIARFISDSVKTVVAYNAKGVWHYTLRYYNEKKLPHDIRSAVKTTYYDYDILGATEVLYEDQNIYLVYVRDEYTIKTISVSDDDMQEIQSFKRE